MRYVILETVPRPRISLAATRSVDRTPPRNGNDPAKRFAELRRVMRRFPPDLKQAFLQNIVGFRLVLEDAKDHAFQFRAVPPIQRRQCRMLTTPYSVHQNFVGLFANSGGQVSQVNCWCNHGLERCGFCV